MFCIYSIDKEYLTAQVYIKGWEVSRRIDAAMYPTAKQWGLMHMAAEPLFFGRLLRDVCCNLFHGQTWANRPDEVPSNPDFSTPIVLPQPWVLLK